MDRWVDLDGSMGGFKGSRCDLHKPDIQHWQEIVAIKIVPK